MALSLANLERNLKLLVVFVLVLARNTNGSECEFCDKNNNFGFAYEIDCIKEYEPRTEGRFECWKSCIVDCYTLCKAGLDFHEEFNKRERASYESKADLQSGSATLKCPGSFCTPACIVFLLLVPLGILGCLVGICLMVSKREGGGTQQQQFGNQAASGMQGQPGYGVQQQQSAYGYQTGQTMMMQQPQQQQFYPQQGQYPQQQFIQVQAQPQAYQYQMQQYPHA